VRDYQALLVQPAGGARVEFTFNAESFVRAEVIARVVAETLSKQPALGGPFRVAALCEFHA